MVVPQGGPTDLEMEGVRAIITLAMPVRDRDTASASNVRFPAQHDPAGCSWLETILVA